MGKAGELANELDGRGADFVLRRRGLKVEQGLDVAAHGGASIVGVW
jgi:hypothetical protein